jgi:alkanesulfonate monooxygenase SsuD/methylene tetrahydromethanopterin reductase-like flavin-dependent oxidoreductase (luciferase family)
VRIGYFADVHGAPYGEAIDDRAEAAAKLDAIVEECLLAERAGFHSIQIPDRHGRGELFPGPLQLLTILARETERVALGPGALVLTLHNPMLVAGELAVIDNLSRGRLYVAIARGWNPQDWRYAGASQERLLGRFLEAAEVLRLAGAGDRISFTGEFFSIEDSLVTPRPYQPGGYPIWAGGQSPAAVRRAAELGHGWVCMPFPLPRAEIREHLRLYRERAAELGKRPFVSLMRYGWVADTFEQAAREFGVHYVGEMQTYFRGGPFARHPDFGSEASITTESVRPYLVIGSRDQCIEAIERYADEYGIDHVSMMLRMPAGPSLEAVEEQVARFGEEVVSHFHRRDPAPDHPAVPEGARW